MFIRCHHQDMLRSPRRPGWSQECGKPLQAFSSSRRLHSCRSMSQAFHRASEALRPSACLNHGGSYPWEKSSRPLRDDGSRLTLNSEMQEAAHSELCAGPAVESPRGQRIKSFSLLAAEAILADTWRMLSSVN